MADVTLPNTHVLDVREKAIKFTSTYQGHPLRFCWVPRSFIARNSPIPPTIGAPTHGTLIITGRGWETKAPEWGIALDVAVPQVVTATFADSPARVDLRGTNPPPQITGSLAAMGAPPFPIWRPWWDRPARPSGVAPQLSEQQEAGCDTLLRGIEEGKLAQLLIGSAGTGKTTILRAFAERVVAAGRNFSILAPTGRAAVRAREVSGYSARTIHGALYKGILTREETVTGVDGKARKKYTPAFHTPKAPCEPGDVIGVDEASMVGRKLYGDLVKAVEDGGGHLVFIGDKGQIEPVMDTWGADFDHPDVELTEVFRQAADNPIIRLANATRYGTPFSADGDPRIQVWNGCQTAWYPATWYASRLLLDGPDVDLLMLCHGNELRRAFNAQVRFLLGYHPGPLARWDAESMLVPGDRVLVRSNNHYRGWMNGDAFTVSAVQPDEEDANIRKVFFHGQDDKYARIPLGLIGAEGGNFSAYTAEAHDRIRRAMGPAAWNAYKTVGAIPQHLEEDVDRTLALTLVDYGYARTIHLSQGSQAREVALMVDQASGGRFRGAAGRRLAYTAITRAEEIYHVFQGIA